MSKTYEPDPVAVEHLRQLVDIVHASRGHRPAAFTLTVPAGNAGANAQRARTLVGWALRETTGAATAIVEIRDLTGALLVPVNLAARESTRDSIAHGVATAGLSVVVVSGSVDGSVFFR